MPFRSDQPRAREVPVRLSSNILLLSLLAVPLTACKKGTTVPEETDDPGPLTIEHCGAVDADEVWEAAALHIITCDVTVTAALQLEPGVEVYADRDTALIIDGGTLTALGESDGPILLGSHEGFPIAGDWVGLVGRDADIQLAWVTVRHAGSTGSIIELEGGTASAEQLILSNGVSTGLSATGTEFSLLRVVEVAYVPTPLELPWTAARVLSSVFFQEVGVEAIVMSEPTLTASATLPAQDFPYASSGVTIQGEGRLEVGAGAVLELSGDIVVEDGSIIAYGDQITGATLQAADEELGFAIDIGEQASAATFRYATFVGGTIRSAARELYFEDCDMTGALGTALTVTGGIQDAHPDNFSDNSFAGTGLGLLVDYDLLPAVGGNDYSASSFDGVAVAGGDLAGSTEIIGWPSERVLVTGDLHFTGGSHDLLDGTLLFADGTGLRVSGGTVTAQGMTMLHQGETAGGWRGVEATGGTLTIGSSTISHGGADEGANITVATDASITGNSITHSAGWGILVEGGASPTIEGNTYQNNALGDVGP
jgi:parallel beta-helix repeat protein